MLTLVSNIDEVIRQHLLDSGMDVEGLLKEMIIDGFVAIDIGDQSHGSGETAPGAIRSHKD